MKAEAFDKMKEQRLKKAFDAFIKHYRMNESYGVEVDSPFGPGPCGNPEHLEEFLNKGGLRIILDSDSTY